jgi:hypothetical protein
MASHNSWRTIVLKGALGIALFAVANFITYETSGYFQREDEYHSVVQNFFTHSHVKAIFVGDSHVAQIDNEYLADNAYNVGFGGDSLREIYAKLRYLLSRRNEIEILFLTADVHMFGTGRLQSSNGAFADQYLLWTGSPYGFGHGALAAAFNLVPLFNDDFVQYLKRDIAQSFKPAHAEDLEETEGAWQRLPEAERERVARETGAGDHLGIGLHTEPFEWYARIVALAREHGVRVIAVRYPATAEYFESVTPAEDELVERALAAAGVTEVLDFRHAFSDASYFKDPDHLSRKGVAALLQLLEDRTQQRLTQRKAASADGAPAALLTFAPGTDAAQ